MWARSVRATWRPYGPSARGSPKVFAAEDDRTAAEQLNALVASAGTTPQLTDHDGYDWHVHYFAPGASVAEHLAADGGMALAFLVVAGERERLRRCEAPDCRHAFVDLSRNRSRRYCDSRTCGNRLHVAAYRARRREAGGLTPGVAPAGPGAAARRLTGGRGRAARHEEQKADDGEEEHQRRLGQREQATARFGGRGVVCAVSSISRRCGAGLADAFISPGGVSRSMTRGTMIAPDAPDAGTKATAQQRLVQAQIPCFFRIASMSEKSSLGHRSALRGFPLAGRLRG